MEDMTLDELIFELRKQQALYGNLPTNVYFVKCPSRRRDRDGNIVELRARKVDQDDL